jgi:DNA helicase HerA-like ATPase
LLQRAALLEALISESSTNESLRDVGSDVLEELGPGIVVVADLTDPLLASDEANGIFQVLVEQFRAASFPGGCGKLLALDEAHKFMDGSHTDGLSSAIVNAARLMRHDGLRLVVSTQSPKALAPELLELVSVAVLHRFHSQDWFTYLSAKIPLPDSAFESVMDLPPGQALVFAARHGVQSVHSRDPEGGRLMRVDVRARLTADRGASRTNVG